MFANPHLHLSLNVENIYSKSIICEILSLNLLGLQQEVRYTHQFYWKEVVKITSHCLRHDMVSATKKLYSVFGVQGKERWPWNWVDKFE